MHVYEYDPWVLQKHSVLINFRSIYKKIGDQLVQADRSSWLFVDKVFYTYNLSHLKFLCFGQKPILLNSDIY